MKEINNLAKRSIKWRFKNPVTIVMTMVQPLVWLVLFANLFTTGTNNYMRFILAGILVMAILFSSGMSGIANYSLRANGSYYRVIISPISRKSIIIAHVLDAVVLSGIQITALLIIAFLFGVRIETGFIGFLCLWLLLIIMIAVVATLSYLLSIHIPDENGFIAMINTLTLPLFFLSTALVQKGKLSPILEFLISINPISYVVDSLRNLIMGPTIDWQIYGASCGGMFVLAIFLIIAVSKKLEALY
ncbi:ABC-2 type transport system permease [Enterococcus sp. AZ194]|uniref:ABC transporter permease n=1 Tax=Enterococcus sp. AZ194 TaxID=2774629 RepID=UPI003F207569